MTNFAVRLHQHGGPENFHWETSPIAAPASRDVLVRHRAVGLNFIDIYHRTGLYPVPLPAILGQEAAGVVEAVGSDVTEFRPGDRVAYAGGPTGAYSECRLITADRLVPIPNDISDDTAAAMMLKGLTVEYLFCRLRPLRAGETILFHAAAGGVGLIACQWARHLGATVIGTASTPEKAALAIAHGAHHIINPKTESLVDRVRDLTNGRGVPVVYDSVGQDTYLQSLDCLSPRGLLVVFGQSSGPVPPFDIGLLNTKGSLFVTRPSLGGYLAERNELLAASQCLMSMVSNHHLKITIDQRYPLRDVAQAHRDLESRRTTGCTVLTV